MGTFGELAARRDARQARDARYPKLHVGLGGRARAADHEAFCKHGIPYVFFWTPDARCYHEKCDTLANIDLPHMAQITPGRQRPRARARRHQARSRAIAQAARLLRTVTTSR